MSICQIQYILSLACLFRWDGHARTDACHSWSRGPGPPTRVRLKVVSLNTSDPAQSVAMPAGTDGLPPRLGIDRFHASRQRCVRSPGRGTRTHPTPYQLLDG